MNPTEREYILDAARLIKNSYLRSRTIDQDCQDDLEVLRKRLHLLPQRTTEINNQLLQIYQSAIQAEQAKMAEHGHSIRKLIEGKFDTIVEQLDRIENREVALGLEDDLQTTSLSYTQMGNAQLAQGQIKAAIACFEEAIRRDPENAAAFLSLGDAHDRQGETETGLNYLRKACSLYQHQHFPAEEIAALKQVIQQLEQKQARKQPWKTLAKSLFQRNASD